MGGVTHLLLLLCVGVTVSTEEDLQKRVIKGTKCRDDDRLYHVKLVDKNENFVCGGSLITDQWVLTAAHCKKGVKKAVVGVHPGPGEPVKKKKTRTYWKIFTKHDIMLMKLKEATGIIPVKLPDCANRPRLNIDKVQVAGHASSAVSCPRCKNAEPRTNDLQCADLGVMDCPWITNPLQYKKRRDRVFCGDTTNADVCSGDSGGGVVHNGMIYGVISAGYDDICLHPVIFMDVCSYMDWINKTIAEQTGCFGCG